MHMLYNSDSFAVVAFEIPHGPVAEGEPTPEPRGGFEIVDKFAKKDIFLEGAVAETLQGRRDGADGQRAERGRHGRIHRPLHRGDAPAARPALIPGAPAPGRRPPEPRGASSSGVPCRYEAAAAGHEPAAGVFIFSRAKGAWLPSW